MTFYDPYQLPTITIQEKVITREVAVIEGEERIVFIPMHEIFIFNFRLFFLIFTNHQFFVRNTKFEKMKI